MSSRDQTLSRLREIQPAPSPLPEVPIFECNPAPLVETFRQSLEKIGGIWCPPPADGDLDAFIHTRYPDARVFCSVVPEIRGTRDIHSVTSPHDLNDVDVAIIRPVFAVAETGSLWISEREYQVNALGYLSQHLVALLDINDIIGNLHHAYHRQEFFEASYAVLMSGPSATADIEGVLIHGAQGIRSLTVIPVPRSK